jgi:myo-inositol-1(or 4)-monophosphatase
MLVVGVVLGVEIAVVVLGIVVATLVLGVVVNEIELDLTLGTNWSPTSATLKSTIVESELKLTSIVPSPASSSIAATAQPGDGCADGTTRRPSTRSTVTAPASPTSNVVSRPASVVTGMVAAAIVVPGVVTGGAASAVPPSSCAGPGVRVFTMAASDPALNTPATDSAMASLVFIVAKTRPSGAPGWVFGREARNQGCGWAGSLRSWSMTGVAIDDLLEVCVAAARAGGAVLTEGLSRDKQVVNKSERSSIVTWADVTSQRVIFEVIGSRFPRHAILGEEGDGGGDDTSFTWIVDPLDGTSNYAAGIPFACVSVAVKDADGVLAGAIFEPFRGELFTAARGAGAWLHDSPLEVSTNDSLARALVATGLQSDDPAEIAAHARRIEALHLYSRGARGFGSPALCMAYVAAGRLDAFYERDATYAWDVAAASLMITEAGGRCDDLDGGPLNLGKGLSNVLATNGKVHADLFDLIQRTDRS